ncbi:MAG: glycerophosphodiester phosphodiesterase family protein [Gemmatimonadota bacterium]
MPALELALDRRWMSRAAEGQVPEVVHAPMRRWGIRIVTQQLVRRVHDAGRTIQVWTINEPLVASRLDAWQVDGIITDDVRAMRTMLRQRPAEMESEVE